MCLSAWLVAVTCVAVPAKKGIWKALNLKDGTTVKAQLRGDEHLHFWETPDGKRYLVESETGRYIPADMDKMRQKANARKARVSQARAQRRVRIGGNHDPYIGKKKGLIILTQFKGQTFESGHDKSLYNEITNSPGFSRLGFNMMMDVNSEGVMVTPSLDPSNPNSQDVQPDDEEYNDEFGAKGASVWD